MADDFAEYQPEVTAPVEIPSPAAITEQSAQTLGNTSELLKRQFQIGIQQPLISAAEQKGLTEGAQFDPGLNITPEQLTASNAGIKMAQLSMSQDIKNQSQSYQQQVLGQGISNQTLGSYQNLMSGYAEGTLENASPIMKGAGAAELVREETLGSDQLQRKISTYNTAIKQVAVNQQLQFGINNLGQTARQSPNGIPDSADPKDMDKNQQAAFGEALSLHQANLLSFSQGVTTAKEFVNNNNNINKTLNKNLILGEAQGVANKYGQDVQSAIQNNETIPDNPLPEFSKNLQNNNPAPSILSDKDIGQVQTQIGKINVQINNTQTLSKSSNNLNLKSLNTTALHEGDINDSDLNNYIANSTDPQSGLQQVQINKQAFAVSQLKQDQPINTIQSSILALQNGNDPIQKVLSQNGYSSSENIAIQQKAAASLRDYQNQLNTDPISAVSNSGTLNSNINNTISHISDPQDQQVVSQWNNAPSVDQNGNLIIPSSTQISGIQKTAQDKVNYLSNVLNLPSSKLSLYPTVVNNQITSQLNSQSPSQMASSLSQLQNIYGSSYPVLLNGLTKAGLSPVAQLATLIPPLSPRIQQLNAAFGSSLKDLKSEVDNADQNSIRQAILSNTQQYFSSKIGAPDVDNQTYSLQRSNLLNSLQQWGLFYKSQNPDASSSEVANFVTQDLTNRYTFIDGGKLAVPNTITTNSTDSNGNEIPKQVAVPAPSEVGLILEQAKQNFLQSSINQIQNDKNITQDQKNRNIVTLQNNIQAGGWRLDTSENNYTLVGADNTSFSLTSKEGIRNPVQMNLEDIVNNQNEVPKIQQQILSFVQSQRPLGEFFVF